MSFEFCLRMGDSALILSHRLSEWCGHGPALEEDIALANTALDLLGQAEMWLRLAGDLEGAGRTADDLAYHREAHQFRNLLLVEQPNGDFGVTILRQFLFDTWHGLVLERLCAAQGAMAEIAAKAAKEVRYHQDRSADLVVRLGDGSEESHARMQSALDLLWPLTGELCGLDDVDRAALPDADGVADGWQGRVAQVLTQATLQAPDLSSYRQGGKTGAMHSEHLGHLLATLQILPRSYPDATW